MNQSGNMGKEKSFDQQASDAQYGVAPTPYHIHDGIGSPLIGKLNSKKLPNGKFINSISIGGFTIYPSTGIEFEPVNNGQNKAIQNAAAIVSTSSSSSVSIVGSAVGSGVTSIVTGIDTLVTPSINFLSGIIWDSVNSQFIVVTAGVYMVIGLVTYMSSTDGKLYQTEIFINGNVAVKSYSQAGATGSATGLCVTQIFNLNIRDKIQLYTWQNSGSNASIYNTSPLTYLSIAKI
jgi:hypothetical protein